MLNYRITVISQVIIGDQHSSSFNILDIVAKPPSFWREMCFDQAAKLFMTNVRLKKRCGCFLKGNISIIFVGQYVIVQYTVDVAGCEMLYISHIIYVGLKWLEHVRTYLNMS